MLYSPQNPNKNLSDTKFTKISFKIFENFSNFVVGLTLFCSFNRIEKCQKKMSEKNVIKSKPCKNGFKVGYVFYGIELI